MSDIKIRKGKTAKVLLINLAKQITLLEEHLQKGLPKIVPKKKGTRPRT